MGCGIAGAGWLDGLVWGDRGGLGCGMTGVGWMGRDGWQDWRAGLAVVTEDLAVGSLRGPSRPVLVALL